MQNNLLPMVIEPYFLTICPHPFLMERINRLAPFGLSIQEILDSIIDLPKDCTTSIQVDGTPIHPDVWSSYYPSEGSPIAIRVVPMSGGDEGKNPFRMFLMLVVMIASFYVGGAFAVAWQGALASAAVTMVGTLLVNALCPPAQARLTERAGVNVDGVVNSITNARNQANPFGPIPVLLGNHRLVPFYGARPYTEIVGNDQYLRLLFVPCYTPVILSAFKIGETNLEDFEGVELEVKSLETDDEPTLYTNTIYEESVNVELLQVNDWTTRTTQADIDEIIVDVVCPKGLFVFDVDGTKLPKTVYYEMQYAVKDSGDWVESWNYFPIAPHTRGPMRPFWQGNTIWRVLFNFFTKETYVLEGYRGTIVPGYIFISPIAPPIPDGSCSLAQIYFPMASGITPITDSMITDERSADCFDFEDPDDFLVIEQGIPDDWVIILEGSYRLRPYITGQTSEAVRKAMRIKISKGQYDVRLRRITADSADSLVYDDLYWSVLRSVTYESPTNVDNVALIAMRIKATDQLSGVIDTFNCVGTSICKDWDTGTSSWIERATVNPASLYRYVLQHPSNKRAVADAKIDLTKLQEWHEFCQPTKISPDAGSPAVDKGGGKIGIPCTDHPFVTGQMIYMFGSVAHNGRAHVDEDTTINEIVVVAGYIPEIFTGDETIHSIGLQYNSLIDYQSSISEILQQIAAAGKASPTYVDGKYSVVIDQVQDTPIQHFTPRNSWDFSGSKTYPRIPHALRVIFANRLTNWEIDERIVYADGYSVDGAGETEAATLFEQLELPGVTDPELAYVLGRYHLAVLTLRPERYSFYADVENLVATRGDLIRVTHDVPLWGVATGRIKTVTDNGTHATAVVMDSIMTMAFEKTYSIRFRLSNGSTLLAAIDLNIGEQTTLVFTDPILLANAPEVDDLGLFGESGEESVELLILSIEPGEDLTARVTCVDYSPAIYTASTDFIGEHDSHITPPYSDIGRSGIPEIYQIRSGESVLYRDTDGSLRPRIVVTLLPVGGYIDKIAATDISWKVYETDEPWKTNRVDGYAQELVILDVEEGVEYSIRLRFILYIGDPTQWCIASQHTVVGKTTAPDVPSSISANPVIAGVRIEWTNPTVVDFQSTGIWRAEADSFPGGTAKYVVPGKPGEVISFVDRDVAYTVTYYYWLKSYDTAGNASSESSSVNDNPYYVQGSDIFDTIQSENYVEGVSGWFIGFRGEDDGYAEFNDVTIRGTLIAGEIHIPDLSTANSFHVASDGDTWWGCSEADFNSNPANATAYVLKDGTVKFAGGVIAGWTLGATTLSSTNITIDSGNNRIISSNYVSGISGAGFLLQSDLLEVGNIACRGIFRTVIFQKDVISAVGGNLVVLPADVLKTTMTAADGDPLTRITEDGNIRITEAGDTRIIDSEGMALLHIEGNESFTAGDILRIKNGIDDEWFEIGSVQHAPEYYVIRDKAEAYVGNANPEWTKGASVINYGASGDGAVYMTASETNAPYLSVFTHAGDPWNTITTHLRIGNLKGFLEYPTDIYGIAIGEVDKYLKYDPTNGLQVKGDIVATTITTSSGTVGGWTLGAISLTSTNIGLHSGASAEILLGHATDYASAAIGLKNDGSGKLANGNIVWTAGGDITLGDANSYLKWTAGALSVKMASGETFELYGNLDVKSGGDITFTGHDTIPGYVKFDGSGSYDSLIATDAGGANLFIIPDTDEQNRLYLGSYGEGVSWSRNRWITVGIQASNSVALIARIDGDSYTRIILTTISGGLQTYNATVPTGVNWNTQVVNLQVQGSNKLTAWGSGVLIRDTYLNFNTTQGAGGYGFKDDSGTMKFKNSGGAWTAFGGGNGGGDITDVLGGTAITVTNSSGPQPSVAVTNNSIGATQLNVSGTGTTSHYLRSDGDGSFTWATPAGGNGGVDFGNYFFNILDYGASPGGAASTNRAAMQVAINAASVNGGVVYFPAGHYHIDATITVGSGGGVHLKGAGRNVTIIHKTTSGGIVIDHTQGIGGVSDIGLRGSGGTTVGLALRGRGLYENLLFEPGITTGVYIIGPDGWQTVNNILSSTSDMDVIVHALIGGIIVTNINGDAKVAGVLCTGSSFGDKIFSNLNIHMPAGSSGVCGIKLLGQSGGAYHTNILMSNVHLDGPGSGTATIYAENCDNFTAVGIIKGGNVTNFFSGPGNSTYTIVYAGGWDSG